MEALLPRGDRPGQLDEVATNAQSVYCLCMATRTISLREEAYERLRRAKRTPSESFSEVVMRAVWPDAELTGETLLRKVRERGRIYRPEELDRVERATSADAPPGDKWAGA